MIGRTARLATMFSAAVATTMISNDAAQSEELRLLAAGIIEHDFSALAAQFEKRSGIRIAAEFNPSGNILKWVQSGEPCDLVVLSSRPEMQQLFDSRRAVPESHVAIGTAVIGVAVKEGAPYIDISTPQALKQAMLKAKAFAHTNPAAGSSSGAHVQKVITGFGIAGDVANKILMRDRGQATIRAVAEGLADFVVAQSTEIVAVKGVRYVGPLPAGIQVQNMVGASQCIAGAAKPGTAEFLKFVASVEVRAHWRALGFADP